MRQAVVIPIAEKFLMFCLPLYSLDLAKYILGHVPEKNIV
jgi:hypothetical protein